jgi:hypothetical protein
MRTAENGLQEVPTLSSSASGEIDGRIAKNGMAISYELSYEDFETAVAVAHIHLGARGTNGGVVAFLCGGGPRPDHRG